MLGPNLRARFNEPIPRAGVNVDNVPAVLSARYYTGTATGAHFGAPAPDAGSGAIATTGGPMDFSQRLDAWGRPIVMGKKGDRVPGNFVGGNRLVNDPGSNGLTWGHIATQYVDKDNHELSVKPGGPGWVKRPPPTPTTPSTQTPSSSHYNSNSNSGSGSGDRSSGPVALSRVAGRTGAALEWQKNAEPGEHYGTYFGTTVDRSNLATLDVITGNMDRHGGNFMVKDGRMIAIDHGYAFPSADKTGNDYGRMSLRSFLMTKPPTPDGAWEKAMATKIKAIPWEDVAAASTLSAGEQRALVSRARLAAEHLSKGDGQGLSRIQKLLHFSY